MSSGSAPDGAEERGGDAAAPAFLATHSVLSGAVLRVVTGHFRARARADVVLARESSLELLQQRGDSTLQSVWEQAVFDTVLDARLLPWSPSRGGDASHPLFGLDLLLVAAGSGTLTVVAFDAAAARFAALQRVWLPGAAQAWARPAWRLAVDPAARFVAAATLGGTLLLLPCAADVARPLEEGALQRVPLPAVCWSLDSCGPAPGAPPQLLALLAAPEFAHAPQLAVLVAAPGCAATVEALPVLPQRDALCLEPAFMGPLEVLAVPGAPGAALLLHRHGTSLLATAAVGGRRALTTLAAVTHVNAPLDALPSAWLWAPHDGTPGAPAALLLAQDCGALLLLLVDAAAHTLTARAIAAGGPAQSWGCISTLAWLPDGCLLACTHDGDGTILGLPAWTDAQLAATGGTLPAPAHLGVLSSASPTMDVAAHARAPLLAAGCGWAGSLRALRPGAAVRQLMATAPCYAGVTGVWAVPLGGDGDGAPGGGCGGAHTLLLVSFVAATRALALGASDWRDVSDAIGIDVTARTLAAGALGGGVLAQVCPHAVRAIALRPVVGGMRGTLLHAWLPAAPDGVGAASPGASDAVTVAAVGQGAVLLALAHARAAVLLRLAPDAAGGAQLLLARAAPLGAEASCMCIAPAGAAPHLCAPGAPDGPLAVVGTYGPHVAVLSLAPGAELALLASWPQAGPACAGLPPGGAPSDYLPHALHVAAYPGGGGGAVLVGTRGGALLRLERGAAPGALRCVRARALGRVPLGLVPLSDALEGDVLALSERPWLLRMVPGAQRLAAQPLAPPADCATVCAAAIAPPGAPACVLLVTGARLRLVTLQGAAHARCAASATALGVAPRRVVPHPPSGCVLLAYALPSDQMDGATRHELCAVHPGSGTPVSAHARLRAGEAVHALAAWLPDDGDTEDALLLVGTSLGLEPGVQPHEADLGRLLIMRLDLHAAPAAAPGADDSEEEEEGAAPQHAPGPRLRGSGEWVIVAEAHLPGAVLAVAGGPEGHLAVSAGASVYCLRLQPGVGAPAALAALARVARVRLRYAATGLAWHGRTLLACDARDGAHLLRLREGAPRPLELVASERAACAACGVATAAGCAAGIDRDGGFFAFAVADEGPEPDAGDSAACLGGTARYRLGGVPTGIVAAGDRAGAPDFIVSTLAGGLATLRALHEDELALLCDAETAAAAHPLTAPLLGGAHADARGGPPAQRRVVDGDLLAQLLALPAAAQRDVLTPCLQATMGEREEEDAALLRILDLLDAVLNTQ